MDNYRRENGASDVPAQQLDEKKQQSKTERENAGGENAEARQKKLVVNE